MTPLQIISLALKITGVGAVGQSPLAEDINDSLTILNSMIASWNKKRWAIYHLVDVSTTGTSSLTYNIGTGQTFNVARPDGIESAFVRFLPTIGTNTVDTPLDIINSREEYAALSLKNLQSVPRAVFYDATYPIGTVYVYPVPSNKYEIHLQVKETIPVFTNLKTDVVLPPEYQEAIVWNLAVRLRPLFGLPPEKTIVAIADGSLHTLRVANAQIPRLSLPGGLSRSRGWYAHGFPQSVIN